MPKTAHFWPSTNTRALIAGKYERLFEQCKSMFGERQACRIILRSVLRKAEETDDDAFEEPRRAH